MQKAIGIGVVFIAVFGGFVMASGKLIALWQPAELVIIFGAGIGSMVIGNPRVVLEDLAFQLKQMFNKPKDRKEIFRELLSLMHLLLEDSRLKGMKALDEHIEAPYQSSVFLMYPEVLENPMLVSFITDNFRMLAMGKMSAHEIEALLESEIMALEEEMLKPSEALHRTGEAMPGFGILAAVLGIIITMQQLDGPLTAIGIHVAAALVGTFIGIFLCYCVFEPFSSALSDRVKQEMAILECVKVIMVSHVGGKSALLSVDAGRKLIEREIKPSFTEMEKWVTNRAM